VCGRRRGRRSPNSSKLAAAPGRRRPRRRTARSTGQLVVSYWSVRRHGGRGARDRRQMYGIHSRDQFVNGAINISQSTTSSTRVRRSRLPSVYVLCDRFLQPRDKQGLARVSLLYFAEIYKYERKTSTPAAADFAYTGSCEFRAE